MIPSETRIVTVYEKPGFRRIEPFYELPGAVREWFVFMELPLYLQEVPTTLNGSFAENQVRRRLAASGR
jgi:hypothetical protein